MGGEMKLFEKMESIAGILQPGDATRYEMVAVRSGECVEVVVLNDGFFDKITFVYGTDNPYQTFRGEKTNPWTIKAAIIMKDKLIKEGG